MSKKDTKNTIKNATPGDEVIDENPDLQKMVEPDTDLKNWLVEYVGEKIQPKNDEVTLEMIIEIVAREFPEFLLPVAEENFIRGYQQAMLDVEESEKALKKTVNQ